MSTRKKVGFVIGSMLLLAALIDAVRFLKPDAANKQVVLSQNSFPISSAKEIILVYNAWGGIYPGILDFIHKEFFPASYPCNLCYQTFGTFSMKRYWKDYLDSLPYKKTELHKENFQSVFKPESLTLPVILITNDSAVQVLVSADELNQQQTLEKIIEVVKTRLMP